MEMYMTFQCPHCNIVAKSETGLQKHIASAHTKKSEDEILIDGRKRIKTIQDEFTALYPYLGIHFFTEQEISKSKKGESIQPLDGDLALSKVRTMKGSTNSDFRVNSRMFVETMETNFRNEFGLHIQICYQMEQKSYYTSGDMDKLSLKELNASCEKKGCQKFAYSTWRK